MTKKSWAQWAQEQAEEKERVWNMGNQADRGVTIIGQEGRFRWGHRQGKYFSEVEIPAFERDAGVWKRVYFPNRQEAEKDFLAH